MFQSGQKSPYEFAKISKELGFQGIEYVSQFYPNVSTDKSAFSEFVNRNKDLSNENEVRIITLSEDSKLNQDEKNQVYRIERNQNKIIRFLKTFLS